QALVEASRSGPLVICPVVYAELAAAFDRREELQAFLGDVSVQVEGYSQESLWMSASAWRSYSRQRGRGVQCPRCGNQFEPQCPACEESVSWRQHIIPDFLIGGHALEQADVLMTRDRGYFRLYFPKLQLLVPEGTQ
ncbi:MAG: type II toxin-antitoxin system VapC family toxin, partial [Chloroflexota bacterium]|nr:type II toxin-antitoxin system VapC family toxin [Chloroflexota bacterium]